MKITYPYICQDTDRHGNKRIYFRRRGRKIRLRASPGTAEFQAEYDTLLEPERTTRSRRDTYRSLVERYVASAEFRSLDPGTQRQKRRVLDSTCMEPLAPASDKLMGDCPLKTFDRQHVRTLRDRKAAHREASRHRLKTISLMFEWAIEAEIEGVSSNPVLHVKYPKPLPGGGHYTWSGADKQKYEQRHSIGSKARLAFGLLYYTGLRVSDAVRIGPEHMQGDGSLKITLHKNRNRSPVTLELPVLEELKCSTRANLGQQHSW